MFPSHVPLVSIVIPTHNYRHYLGAALESCAAQSWPACEVVVVDDGSNDGTQELVRNFAPRLRCVYLWQERSGPAAARNHGIRVARGEFVCFLDADDVQEPHRVERQVQSFVDPQVGAVLCEAIAERNGAAVRRIGVIPPGANLVRAIMLHEVEIFSASTMFRQSALDTVGGFNVGLEVSEGLDLVLRVASSWILTNVGEVLIRHRLHAESFSATATTQTYLDCRLRIIESHLGLLPDDAARRRARANVYRRVGPWFRQDGALRKWFAAEWRALATDPAGLVGRGGVRA